jgi:hypothetical protein
MRYNDFLEYFLVLQIWIGSGLSKVSISGFGVRIRIQKGKNYQKRKKKLRNNLFRSAGFYILRTEGFKKVLHFFQL